MCPGYIICLPGSMLTGNRLFLFLARILWILHNVVVGLPLWIGRRIVPLRNPFLSLGFGTKCDDVLLVFRREGVPQTISNVPVLGAGESSENVIDCSDIKVQQMVSEIDEISIVV